MGFLAWVQDNWFVFLQSLGIVGGLSFTGIALLIDARVRKVGNLFEITKQHREIWTLLYTKEELKRVLDPRANLSDNPVTENEKIFVNLLILHLATSHRAAKAGVFTLPQELETDIRDFFSHPVPRTVWEMMRPFQDLDFVRFVDERR
jgi:hypothetical protein